MQPLEGIRVLDLSQIIYCSISGFGQTGPYSSRGGFELVAQGMSGLMSMRGEPERRPRSASTPTRCSPSWAWTRPAPPPCGRRASWPDPRDRERNRKDAATEASQAPATDPLVDETPICWGSPGVRPQDIVTASEGV